MPELTVEQAFTLALQHHQAGRLSEANQIYQQILAQQPNHAAALHYSGSVALQTGNIDLAIDLIRRAIAIHPNPAAWTDLGVALNSKGYFNDAIDAHRKAIALKPDYPAAYSNLGNALRDIGELDQAIAAYRQAIALRPDFVQAHTNLGVTLTEAGKIDDAIAAHRQAVALRPNRAGDYNSLGNLLRRKGQVDDALAAYRQAVALEPNFAAAHSNLGVALANKGQLDDALAAYRHAISLQPDLAQAHINIGDALKDSGELNEAIASLRRGVELDPGNAAFHSSLVYVLHLHPDYDVHKIAEEARRWNRLHAEPLRHFIRAHRNDRNPDRPLRIGYVSPDFRVHPIGRFLLPLFNRHDKKQFQFVCYSKVAAADPITQRLRAHADTWCDVLGLSDAQLADLVRDDKIDILVDLSMHMNGNSLLTFARKPAPVQLTWLAYCSTTGLTAIDYRLTDPHLDPPPDSASSDESVYSEKTLRLPETYWCYDPIIPSADVSSLPAAGGRPITFGCLSNFCKVSPANLAAWMDLLNAVPNSEFLLSLHQGSVRDRLPEQFESRGIARSRIRFVGKVPIPEYFRLYNQIDIALDTFPYAGGTTTCDALWMGVPVVTLAGKTAVGRGGVSILTNIGVPELISHTIEEYTRIAADLAADESRLTHLRATLHTRFEQSPLMNAPHFAQNIEAAYREIWRTWCAGSHPE